MKSVLLIVDDERATRSVLSQALEENYEVYSAANAKAARAVLESEPVDILLTDLRLGGESGMDLIDYAMGMANPPTCIMMTAYGSRDTAAEAKKHGAYYFLTKPLNLDEVELLLRRAEQTRHLEKNNRELNQQLHPTRGLDAMLGDSPVMRALFDRIRQVAPTNATVLIEGETGTGKELVARALHTLSPRSKSGKFVAVNCAALSPQLMESELFGHEKGAFTHALQRRIGRFEEADGGTLFFDEIGEMDIPMQVKLLRALAERSIERVGSNESIPVDVRIIAATNRDLQSMVDAGQFRLDLYQRLNVVDFHLPALRQRAEDIVLLSNAFVRQICEENNKPLLHISRAVLDLLRRYDWPGNVRQLRAAIEHSVILCEGNTITPIDLPDFLNGQRSLPAATGEAPAPDPIPPADQLNLDKLIRRTILRALQVTNGNRTASAKLLGIDRRTLQRHLSSAPQYFSTFTKKT